MNENVTRSSRYMNARYPSILQINSYDPLLQQGVIKANTTKRKAMYKFRLIYFSPLRIMVADPRRRRDISYCHWYRLYHRHWLHHRNINGQLLLLLVVYDIICRVIIGIVIIRIVLVISSMIVDMNVSTSTSTHLHLT